jgi:3-isopropylmalate dehydrogenase
MCLRYSFGLGDLADKIEAAIATVLGKGLRTADIKGDAKSTVSTAQMGDAVLEAVKASM